MSLRGHAGYWHRFDRGLDVAGSLRRWWVEIMPLATTAKTTSMPSRCVKDISLPALMGWYSIFQPLPLCMHRLAARSSLQAAWSPVRMWNGGWAVKDLVWLWGCKRPQTSSYQKVHFAVSKLLMKSSSSAVVAAAPCR